MALRLPEPRHAEPDLIPLISVVSTLLGCLLLVAQFAGSAAAERQKLPKSALARPPAPAAADDLVVAVRSPQQHADGQPAADPVLTCNGRECRLSEFGPHLEQERRRLRTRQGDGAAERVTVVLRADADLPTSLVRSVVQTCQAAGFTRFSLKVAQEE